MQIDLSGQIALVTGASRGIGREIARQLGHCGATVVGTATTRDGAEAITQRMKDDSTIPHASHGVCLNVTDQEGIEAVIKQLSSDQQSPTILVNNAGITRDGLLMRMKEQDWHDIIDINLSAIYRLSKACLRGMMKARHGRIINIGSVIGSMGNPGQVNYAAAKAGLLGFSKALAYEVGTRGITVNTVAPGYIITDMTEKLGDDQRQQLQNKIPLGRLGECSDIAAAVTFLASDLAAYITGETLHVNGGMHMV